MPSGVYIYRLNAGQTALSKKWCYCSRQTKICKKKACSKRVAFLLCDLASCLRKGADCFRPKRYSVFLSLIFFRVNVPFDSIVLPSGPTDFATTRNLFSPIFSVVRVDFPVFPSHWITSLLPSRFPTPWYIPRKLSTQFPTISPVSGLSVTAPMPR